MFMYVMAAAFILVGGGIVFWAVKSIFAASKLSGRGSRFGERFAGVLFTIAGLGLILLGVTGPSINADYKDRVASFNDRCHDVGGKVLSLDEEPELECWKTKLDVPYR